MHPGCTYSVFGQVVAIARDHLLNPVVYQEVPNSPFLWASQLPSHQRFRDIGPSGQHHTAGGCGPGRSWTRAFEGPMANISYLPIPALTALPISSGLVFPSDGNVTMEISLQPPGRALRFWTFVPLQVHGHRRGSGFMGQALEHQPRSEPSIAGLSQSLG